MVRRADPASEPGVDSPGPRSDSPARRRLPIWLQLLVSAASIAITAFLVWPQLPQGEQALDVVRRASVPLAALGLVLELLSLAANSLATRLLVGDADSRYATMLRIDLTALAVNHVAPAGAATSAALRIRLLGESGLPAAEAAAGATVQATTANVVLGGVFLIGIGLAAAGGSDPSAYLAAIVTVLLALGAVAGLAVLLVRRAPALRRWAGAATRRFPRIPLAGLSTMIGSLSDRVRGLVRHPSSTSRVLLAVAANWLFDAASLWVMLAAAGVRLGPGPLLVVYGLGNLVAMLPVTPGGLGIVEGVMIPALVGFGVPRSAALVGVLGWRLWQLWMPLPLGAIAYPSLRLGALRHHDRTPDGR